MKIRIKLSLADSGQPLCLVVRALKLPQFEVSILLGVSRHLPPLHLQTLIEHWWGWWDPPFSWLLCPTISCFMLYFKNKLCIIFVAQRTVATNLTVSSSKRKKHPQFEVSLLSRLFHCLLFKTLIKHWMGCTSPFSSVSSLRTSHSFSWCCN